MVEDHIPHGVAFCRLNDKEVATEHYVFILVPSLSMNALSSAIEPLRIANQLTRKVLFKWRCLSEDGQPVRCSNGLEVSVNGSIDDIQPHEIAIVCSGVQPKAMSSKKVADEIRRVWRRGQTVGGICTGTYTLAEAGILKGTPVTLHWENIPAFRELYPDLDVNEHLFHFGDRIWTCAGGVAATDMMISRILKLHGLKLSRAVTTMCLHQVPRVETEPQKVGSAAAITVRHPSLEKIIDFIESDIEGDLTLDAIAKNAKISRRQMERLFKTYLAITPKQFIKQSRLHRGRAIMAETNLSTAEVAAACGFNSSSHFSKNFKALFGVSPFHFIQTGEYKSPSRRSRATCNKN